MARGDLTDGQWVRLEAVLPPLPVMSRPCRDRRPSGDGRRRLSAAPEGRGARHGQGDQGLVQETVAPSL